MTTRLNLRRRLFSCRHGLGAMAVLLAITHASGVSAAEGPPTIIPRVKAEPTIDGDVNDPCWAEAVLLDNFTKPKSTERPGKRIAARLCFDDRALYICLVCEEPNPERIRDEQTPGQSVWRDDCVEIWIRTTDDLYEFDQFIANTSAKREVLRRRRVSKPWSPKWDLACKVDKAEWRAEMAIPFTALEIPAPNPGDMLQMKLGREDRATGRTLLSTWPPGSPYARTDGYRPVYFETDNLLRNPDQTQRKGNRADGWGFSRGDAGLFTPVAEAGTKIVRVSAPGRYCTTSQSLRLKPNSLYRLEASVRGTAGLYLRARTRPKPDGPSKPHTAWAKPGDNFAKYQVRFTTGPKGDALIIIGTTEATKKGRVDIADLRLVQDVSAPAFGQAIPVVADAAEPLTVKKIRATDCRAVRGFVGGPIDGSLDSRGWNAQVWEYNKRGAGAGVGYNYMGNDGLHITLADEAGFNAIVVRGGVRAKVYHDCDSYEGPAGGTLIVEMPGRSKTSRFFRRTPIKSDRISFFEVGDGYIANVSFFRVEQGPADLGAPVQRLAPSSKFTSNIPEMKARFGKDEQAAYRLARAGAGGSSIEVTPGKAFHFVSAPLPQETPLAAIGLDMVVLRAGAPVPFTAAVQDPLNPRSELYGADFALSGPGRARVVLDFPDQIVPKGSKLWVSLRFDGAATVAGPKGGPPVIELYGVDRGKALPEALAYRKLLLKGYFDAMSEARPWNGWYTAERVQQTLDGNYGLQLREIRMTLDQCVALAPEDPFVKQFYEWIWRRYRPWRAENKRGIYLDGSHAKITPVPGAPEWAVVARQAWLEARKVPEWWLDNRLVPNGEMGGVVGDDSDMYQQYADFPMLETGGVAARLREAFAALAELAEKNNLTEGLNRHTTDPLHAYEEGVNHEALMAWMEYGDPVYMERCIVAARSTEALTVMTPKGHRHFKSQMCGASDLRMNRKTDTDGHAHPLMWHPAFEVAWYNQSPKVMKMLREWADGWLEHMSPGKYATGVDVATEKVTSTTDRPLYGGYGGQGSAFEFMYWVTGDEKYLGPFMDQFKAGSNRTSPGKILPEILHHHGLKNVGGKLPELVKREGPAETIFTGNKKPLIDALKVDIAETQNYFIMYTSAEPFTDRVFLHTITNATIAYTGGFAHRNKYCHTHAASYEGFGTDYAALVMKASPSHFKVLLYSFADEPLTGKIRLWTLDHGKYSLKYGPDADGDDKADSVEQSSVVEVARATALPLTLNPKKVMVLELVRQEKLDDIRSRADLALSPLEINVSGRTVTGVAHNIGSRPVAEVEVALVDPRGRITSRKKLGKLDAPLDLVPKRTQFTLKGLPRSPAGWAVVIDPDGKVAEIFEENNRVALPVK